MVAKKKGSGSSSKAVPPAPVFGLIVIKEPRHFDPADFEVVVPPGAAAGGKEVVNVLD